MRSIKISIPVSLVTWWLPLVGGAIIGFISGTIERKIASAIISVGITSAIASTFYILLGFKVLYVPLLGNLLPVILVISSVVNSALAVFVAYFISTKMIRSTFEGNNAKIEFYARDQDEINEKLNEIATQCSEPTYSFHSENEVEVTRRCEGFTMRYIIRKEGKLFKVTLFINGDQ
ncbi:MULTISPECIES: hypothetical protein [Acidianus]|jgi:predicted neutral ceramidase superfamily lipid hydrolase|uniref:Uncharacterized protein n=2 Tax=Acidianus TaxID=12914 RepID=A0A650CY87_ACIAM|nr:MULTISPECIES: hypothetical protein [Acidianus]AEE93880.1 conserved hypothetical protein [Acidianus hospitalis W1]MQL54986.1 hypothetical protein [Acidianus ambivalens]QGR22768.1 hypothetical protein D1866_12855 [Acidianus ambivalens]